MRKIFICLFAGMLLFAACGVPGGQLGDIPVPAGSGTTLPSMMQPTVNPDSLPHALWIAASVPAALRQAVAGLKLPQASSPTAADVRIDVSGTPPPTAGQGSSTWIYSLVAPFPTLAEGVTFDELESAWKGNPASSMTGHELIMDEATLGAMKVALGEPGLEAVRTVASDQVLATAWAEGSTWAIVPFESIEPRWKVLTVDGQSPIRKDFDPASYPLKVTFVLQSTGSDSQVAALDLPSSNRDPSKLTTLIMTGVTALVRATAYRMEEKGVDYPAQDIGVILREADITHISNEIPFAQGCPYPNPDQRSIVFCSDQKYIGLLENVGTDVVELTGNHFMDWGSKATLFTLDLYRSKNIPYYGGGADLTDSRNAAYLEDHGNKFAFIGCKLDSTDGLTATDTHPGAAACDDLEWMANKVKEMKAQGYIVVATFQWQEYYSPEPRPAQSRAFRLMADSGATIVSGSQAHTAQAMEFYNGAFIHYGLGNLFFDQMGVDLPDGSRTTRTRDEFLDRHVFYDGRYLGTELLTALLEDYARPRPMTLDERNTFISYIWGYTDWSKLP
jgi:hypothetical protein